MNTRADMAAMVVATTEAFADAAVVTWYARGAPSAVGARASTVEATQTIDLTREPVRASAFGGGGAGPAGLADRFDTVLRGRAASFSTRPRPGCTVVFAGQESIVYRVVAVENEVHGEVLALLCASGGIETSRAT